MRRSEHITRLTTMLALLGALADPCAAQVANGVAQIAAPDATVDDPFQLERPAAMPPTAVAPPQYLPQQEDSLARSTVDDSDVQPASAVAPLSPPALPRLVPRGEQDAATPLRTTDSSTLVTVGGSLAIVLGLFLLATWFLRRGAPSGASLLPRDALEMLGRAPLPGRQQMHLLRIGNKLLLVNVTQHGAETLTEITDPLEVDRLVGICQQRKPNSSTAAFQSVLDDLGRYGDRDDFADDHNGTGRRATRATRGQGGAHA
ncbi:MAG: flagellar biosynthetic protein FliO [Pirellulales bacterium]|nr:flagellar biosynthetic protein FliO [Pirellulales bacterium]